MSVAELCAGPDELPLDSGVYEYHINGTLTDIREPWRRDCHPDKGVVTRARRYSGQHGFALEVTHWAQDGGECAVQLFWRAGDLVVQAGYQLGSELRVNRSVGGQALEEICLPDDGALFFPLMRVFAGNLIGQLLETGGSGRVLVPAIDRPGEPDSLFLPRFSERRVELLEGQAPEFDGCRCYRYRGGQYGEAGARYWLDESGLLRHYHWQADAENEWRVSLENYSSEQGD